MRYFVLAGVISILASSVCPAQVEPQVQQQVETSEAKVAKAIATKDVVALENLWSPKMIVNSPANNILTRDEVIAALGKGQLNYTGYKNVVEAFETYGDGLALIMGHEELTRADGAFGGKILYRRYTDIWQKTSGSWVQIARQATYTTEH